MRYRIRNIVTNDISYLDAEDIEQAQTKVLEFLDIEVVEVDDEDMEEEAYYQQIYQIGTYSVREMIYLDMLLRELAKRGYNIQEEKI